MSKQEWCITGLVAVAVATMTGALFTPPAVWAQYGATVTVPDLPPAQLEIPSLSATVKATTTPSPGKPVQVTLVATVLSRSDVTTVPVTVTVQSTAFRSMGRSISTTRSVMNLAQASTSVSLDSGGTGSTVVNLPLTWANPNAPQPYGGPGDSTTYQLILSSPSTVTSDTQGVDAVQQ